MAKRKEIEAAGERPATTASAAPSSRRSSMAVAGVEAASISPAKAEPAPESLTIPPAATAAP